MSGHRKSSRTRQKKPLSHGWIVLPSKTYPDRVYFYNTVTKCSTWNNPCEVTNDKEYNSSSEASSSGEKRLFKTKHKSLQTSHPKKQRSKTQLNSPDKNSNIQINSEIEDYDEQQDQYFDNIPINAFSSSLSNIISPLSSPDSITSSRTNISDSDQASDSNILLEDNKKQLWVHFASSPDNPSAKKSVALSDFGEPSTCGDIKMETASGSSRRKSILKDFSEGSEVKCFNESPEKNTFNFNKKKKGKIKKKEHHNKNFAYKTIKNISFKKTDKTPAQTQLLKFRKEHTKRLKELVVKNVDFVIADKNNVEINSKSKNNLNLEKQAANDSFSDAYLKRIEICNNVAQKSENNSEVDFSEEMDWEPSSEESDVRNINTFREQSNKANEVSSDIFFGLNSDHSFILPMKTYSWFLILDTNIFVSCLGFVKELRDTKVPDLGYPVIYVPWRVLQELDHLKDSKIEVVDRHLHVNVRKAIAFLNENFKSRHPRIFGQSFEDFANMVQVETSAPDDEILQTCIKFQKQHADKKLVLLTNDKNLESKAIVSRVEVYSKERFCKKYLTPNAVSPTFSNTLDTTNGAAKTDDYICEIQAILKDFLPLFVETEMKIAFERDWVKLAFKKPPWTLEDTLQCLLKHWRSVFFLNFTKEAHFEAEKLNERLFKRVPARTEDVVEIITTTQRLLLSIRKSQKKKMPYSDLIPLALTKLSDLLKACSPNHSPQTDSGISISLPLSSSANNDSLFHVQQVSQDEVSSSDISKIKNLFKDIWDSLRSFCCSVSDTINSPDARNDMIIQEMKLKLTQILSEVEELVVTVEKIFALNVSDVNDCHPLIIYFSNFLIRVYPAMPPDLVNELPKYLAAFFSDFEVRFLLVNSLKDFRDFIQELSQAAEYFNTHF